MNKLQALNSLEVVDADSDGNECLYVLTEISAENIEILMDAGFTAEQIDEAMGDDKTEIDLADLAFNHADAAWWSTAGGFVAQTEEATYGQD